MEPFEQLSLEERIKFQKYELTEKRYLQAELSAIRDFEWAKLLQEYINYNLSLVNEGESAEERYMYYWISTLVREQANALETSVQNTIRAEGLKEKLISIQKDLQLNLKTV